MAIFQSKDYMRGLVAGVRYLLEKCDCLTRDAPNIQNHAGIRRTRKGLLSDLSSLVKAGKELQVMIPLPALQGTLDKCLDDLLLHAFKIVTRAVKFFDVWGEELVFSRDIPVMDDIDSPLLLAEPNLSQTSVTSSNRHTGSTARYSTISSAANLFNRQSAAEACQDLRQSQPPVIDDKRISMTHRMSYSTKVTPIPNHMLASVRLNQCYDAFLGVLASFLGSHMQSRSSSELLLTTQQAVKSCRQLLALVEMVIERDTEAPPALAESKDILYDAITELVLAAKQVFRPLHASDDDLVYLPEEGRRLVQAATNCVSGAGRCVAYTRAVLDDGGDFETDSSLEGPSSESDNNDTPARYSYMEVHPSAAGLNISGINSQLYAGSETPKPYRSILRIPDSTPSLGGTSPSTLNSSMPPPTPADDNHTGLTRSCSSQATLHSPVVERPISGDYIAPVGHLRHKSLARAIIHSTGSDSTYDSSTGNTDPSDVSVASTRATSYAESTDQAGYASQESLTTSTAPIQEEDEGEAAILEQTYAHELMYNKDGVVVGGTLNALVERLTACDSTPDALFVSTVYLTFRLFAKPLEFANALTHRFKYAGESSRLAGPVRLRVYNVFKGWLESHWRHDCDDVALPSIVAFAREELSPVLQTAGKRLLGLADIVGSTHVPAVPRVMSAIGKTSTSSAAYVNAETPLPPPVLSKSQLTALRTWKMGGAGVGILDFDALELARQITLKTSGIFCSILPEEMLATEWTKQSSSLAVNVRAMSTLSTDISNLVADSVLQLEEPKKRAAIIKQWVKIATKCLELNNYDTVWAIVCSLDSTNIKRMLKTWELIPQKTKALLEELKKVCDVSRNYSTLRQLLSNQVPPCLPFLGVYLTDLTFIDHGNPAKRQLSRDGGEIEVVNLDKHVKTARVISDLQRFQIPYRFAEVSELQTWMQDQLIRVRSAGEKNFQNHYRRSLILEPREQQSKVSPNPAAAKERFDMLGWMHMGRGVKEGVGVGS